MEGLKLRISSPVIEGGMGGDCERSYWSHIALLILNFKRNTIRALWGVAGLLTFFSFFSSNIRLKSIK